MDKTRDKMKDQMGERQWNFENKFLKKTIIEHN